MIKPEQIPDAVAHAAESAWSKDAKLLYTHDDWMVTVTAIEAVKEPRDE
jgi:hypothetical protein